MKFLLMSPEQLKSNKNWKYHPEAQRKALEAALEKLGWTIPIIVNATTGRIIDGHLRFEIAQEKKYEEIPVVVVELTEEQELTALVTLDSIRDMAKMDLITFKEILEGIEIGGGDQSLGEILPDFFLATVKAAIPPPPKKNDNTDARHFLEFSRDQMQRLLRLRWKFDSFIGVAYIIVGAARAILWRSSTQ